VSAVFVELALRALVEVVAPAHERLIAITRLEARYAGSAREIASPTAAVVVAEALDTARAIRVEDRAEAATPTIGLRALDATRRNQRDGGAHDAEQPHGPPPGHAERSTT
jgi:hypothetical protein